MAIFTATKQGLQLQQQNHTDQIQIVSEKNQYWNQADVWCLKSENAFNVQLYHFIWIFKKKKYIHKCHKQMNIRKTISQKLELWLIKFTPSKIKQCWSCFLAPWFIYSKFFLSLLTESDRLSQKVQKLQFFFF